MQERSKSIHRKMAPQGAFDVSNALDSGAFLFGLNTCGALWYYFVEGVESAGSGALIMGFASAFALYVGSLERKKLVERGHLPPPRGESEDNI
jgi:hypothetical protein